MDWGLQNAQVQNSLKDLLLQINSSEEKLSPTILRELQTTASVETRIVQLENAMKEHFQLTDAEIHEVLAKFPFLWKKYYLYAFTYLSSIGVTKETFLRNPWLSTMTPGNDLFLILLTKLDFRNLIMISTRELRLVKIFGIISYQRSNI